MSLRAKYFRALFKKTPQPLTKLVASRTYVEANVISGPPKVRLTEKQLVAHFLIMFFWMSISPILCIPNLYRVKKNPGFGVNPPEEQK